jgi:TfoX/Sxy family transcriptional regulator of competence genes
MTAEDKLAADVRKALAGAGTISEVKMFGGVGFMLDGNMVAAVSRRGLLLRVGKDRYAEALAWRGARPTQMRGRPVLGYVSVDPSTLTDGALRTWLREASTFVKTLPPKATGAKRARKGDRK